jgi:alpha-tubulin suppressor-like RCC1 family protein
VAVLGVNDTVDMDLGSSSSIALGQTGVVKAWGKNMGGQLGPGTALVVVDTPVVVSGL